MRVLARARPIRIAFLVELEAASNGILDAVFEYSYSLWGGRFSLVIPCLGGEPIPEFLPWLKVFDPDLIYAYVDLSPETQLGFHESLYPSSLQHHDFGSRSGKPDYRPAPTIHALGAETVLPLAGAPRAFGGMRGAKIVSIFGSLANDRFLADSFGVLSSSIGNLMQGSLSDFASPLLVVDTKEVKSYHLDKPVVPDGTSLLHAMAADQRIQGVAQLSAYFTPRLNIHSHTWGETFNIVVGDSVEDRILFWNARSLSPAWRDGSDADLCIPRANFDSPSFVEALRSFQNKRNHVNGRGGSGPNVATFRSSSVSLDELAAIAELIGKEQSWITYRKAHVNSVSDCVPGQSELARATWSPGQIRSPGPWAESFTAGDELRLNAPEPEHLRHVPAALLNPSTGAWAVDLDVERSIDHSPYSNVVHCWRLPKRLRVTRAFLSSYQLSQPHGEIVAPRVTNQGFLALFSASKVALPRIRLPSDHDAVVAGLINGRDWTPFHRFEEGRPSQLCFDARRSSAGRYFWGVFQLFGDLNLARTVLLHEFWRKQLDAFGATDQRADARHEVVKRNLLRRYQSRLLDLANPEQLSKLSDLVLREADAVRMTVPALSWQALETDFAALVARYNEANPFPENEQDQIEIEMRRRIGSLERFVQGLCERGILHQGYEVKCGKCLHRGWVGVADLRIKLPCEVCGFSQAAPVNEPWHFRLNGFLREALQRHGIGPLFWVLSRLQRHNSDSFWFDGPLDIYLSREAREKGESDTDVDLTMIDSGVVRMCEVKQSERSFHPRRLSETMAKLRPDIAMVAIMEPLSPAIRKKFSEFQHGLAGSGIEPQLMTLDERTDISSDPYF